MSTITYYVSKPHSHFDTLPRKISRKRARYLRRRGELVRWNVASNFRYWEMPLTKFRWYTEQAR